MTEPLRLAVVGATGRVGTALLRLAGEHGAKVTRAVGHGDADPSVVALGLTLEPDVTALASGGFDVAIDFSTPDLLPKLTAAVVAARAALVSGTTGLGTDGEGALEEASREVPVLWEPNMSVGVFVLGRLVRDAIRALGDDFDVEIVETHHRRKADAPSGTALRLAEIAEKSMKETPGPRRNGRQGRPGPRAPREVGMHAVRGGDVVGDHSVHLVGLGERLELVHRATNRDLFAQGALRAASFIAGKPAGRYRLADVLGE